MAVRGRMLRGRFKPLNLQDAVEGRLSVSYAAVYELTGDLEQTLSEAEAEMAADAVWSRLRADNLPVLGVEVTGRTVKTQIIGAGVQAAEVGALLAPAIVIVIIGIAAALGSIGWIISTWSLSQFVGLIPSWVWSILLLSGAAALVLWSLSRFRMPSFRPRTD